MRYALSLVALILAAGYVDQDDYEESVRQEQQYCEMVAKWREDPSTGWPPFRSDIECKEMR